MGTEALIAAVVVLLIDKAVALSPIPYDDLIWTAIKAALKGGTSLFTKK